LDLGPGEFFSEGLVFKERALPIGKTTHFQALKYDTFVRRPPPRSTALC
jgi:hypothetical protein